MSSLSKVLVALLLLAGGEVLGQSPALNIEGDPSALAFFEAEKLYQQGQSVLAARQWRKVIKNENGTQLLKDIAKNRIDALSKKLFTYSGKLTYQPGLRRRYHSDVFYLNVNGSDLPFFVNREANLHDRITVHQELAFPSILDGRIQGVDMFSLAHIAKLQSDNSVKNILTFTTNFSNPSSRTLLSWSKTLTHDTGPRQKTTADKLGIVYAGMNSLHEVSFTYERPLKVSREERLQQEYVMLHLSSKTSIKTTSILMRYDRYMYDDSGKNYYTLGAKVSKAVNPSMITLSLEGEVRHDDKARFPFVSERNDEMLAVSVSAKLPNLDGIDSVNIAYKKNHSNISIYRFDEFGIYFNFGF